MRDKGKKGSDGGRDRNRRSTCIYDVCLFRKISGENASICLISMVGK